MGPCGGRWAIIGIRNVLRRLGEKMPVAKPPFGGATSSAIDATFGVCAGGTWSMPPWWSSLFSMPALFSPVLQGKFVDAGARFIWRVAGPIACGLALNAAPRSCRMMLKAREPMRLRWEFQRM